MNDDRITQIRDMRKDGYSLREIGVKFSISRQRVHQLIGNTGFAYTWNLAERKKKAIQHIQGFPLTSEEEIALLYRLKLSVVRRVMLGQLHKMGYTCQYILEDYIEAINILKELGINTSYITENRARYLVTVSGIKIPVISRRHPFKNRNKYQISLTKMLSHKVNYFALHILIEGEHNEWLIIPAADIVNNNTTFIYPTINGMANKYIGRWDLIVNQEASNVGR